MCVCGGSVGLCDVVVGPIVVVVVIIIMKM